jgi:hypothetical protein
LTYAISAQYADEINAQGPMLNAQDDAEAYELSVVEHWALRFAH